MVGQEVQKKVMPVRFILITMLIFGQPVLAQPLDGQTFDNWTIRCEKKADQEHCFIFQNLILKEGGSRVLHMAVGFLPGNIVPVIVVSMPLGISLPPGASIIIDDKKPLRFQIERCEPTGCRGGFKLNDKILQDFTHGKSAKVTFYDGNRKPIEVPFVMTGFADGLEALKQVSP